MTTVTTRNHFWSQRELASDRIAEERDCASLIMNVTEDLLVEADRRGLNNSDLAKILGVSRSNVHRQLSGERNMTLRTLSKLAHALGVVAKVVFERAVFNELPENSDAPTDRYATVIHLSSQVTSSTSPVNPPGATRSDQHADFRIVARQTAMQVAA